MEVRQGLESSGAVAQSCVLELWASVKSRSHRPYCDGEAGLALDLHWNAEHRAVSVALGVQCRWL